MNWRVSVFGLVLAGLSGCAPSDPPDPYASNAVRQANKGEPWRVVGVRRVSVGAAGRGTGSAAAVGGISGSRGGVGPVSAITAVGGFAGSSVEHVSIDTAAFEYIVRKPDGDLVSVTQTDKVQLALGQKVLLIAGDRARVVPD